MNKTEINQETVESEQSVGNDGQIGKFPVLTFATSVAICTLSSDLLIISTLLTLILFIYVLRGGVRQIDFVVLLILYGVFFVLANRLSVSLVYPFIGFYLAKSSRRVAAADHCSASFLIILVVCLKVFFALDEVVYLDRNYLGLISALLIITSVEGGRVFAAFIKTLLLIFAAFLLSRNFMVFFALYLLSMPILRRVDKRVVTQTWFPFVYLILATFLSLVVAAWINTDIFTSDVKNEASRIVDVTDASNLSRINALLSFGDYITSNSYNVLFPTTLEEYQNYYGAGTAPHNTLLSIIFNLGLPLSVIYFWCIGGFLRRLEVLRSFTLLFTPYYLILGAVLFGPTIMLFMLAGRHEK